MDKLLTIKREGNWAKLLGNLNGKLSLYVRNYIRPSAYRKFDKGAWLVYYSKLPEIIAVAIKYHSDISYIDIPESWKAGVLPEANISNCYKYLFLQENAPVEVVKASYKALSLLYHPDIPGNDSNKMVELNSNYEQIIKSIDDLTRKEKHS